MKTIVRALPLFVALASAGLAHAQSFSSLEERMSAADFRKAGLDKLSPQELQFLDAWLRNHVGTASAAPAVIGPSNRSGHREPVDQPHGPVASTINGTFSGWDSHTQLPLANGEVWQVSESGGWSCETVKNPKITIKPMILGSWLAYIQGCSNSVRVERVH